MDGDKRDQGVILLSSLSSTSSSSPASNVEQQQQQPQQLLQPARNHETDDNTSLPSVEIEDSVPVVRMRHRPLVQTQEQVSPFFNCTQKSDTFAR